MIQVNSLGFMNKNECKNAYESLVRTNVQDHDESVRLS